MFRLTDRQVARLRQRRAMKDQARVLRGVFAIAVGAVGVATGVGWLDMPAWSAGVELFIAGVFGMDGQRMWKWMFGS